MSVLAVPPARLVNPRLENARRLAEDLLATHGLHDWSFAFNRRKCALGFCYYELKVIELSMYFVEGNPEEAVRDTLLHEIAHALAGPEHGHGPAWKQKCLEIGAKPERVCRRANMPQGRWHACCASCGKSFHRHRRPKWLQGWYCCACGEEKGELVWRCG